MEYLIFLFTGYNCVASFLFSVTFLFVLGKYVSSVGGTRFLYTGFIFASSVLRLVLAQYVFAIGRRITFDFFALTLST